MWRRGKRWVLSPVLGLLGFALVGCPGDDDGAGSAAGDGSAMPSQLCEAHLEWEMACTAETGEAPDGPYWGESECPMGPWRLLQAAYVEAAAECFATLPCERSDDACTAEGFAAIGIESEADLQGDADLERCLTLSRTCNELGEDFCFFFAVFTERGRAEATQCLDLDCPDAATCFDELR